MAHGSNVTRDHEEIKRWAEERGGKPSHVKSTGGGEDVGILRIDFPGYSGEGSLEEIGWDQFFEKFDERGLALLYQDETAGGERSNFNKLVSQETAEEAGEPSKGRARRAKKSAPTAAKKAVKRPAKKTAGKKTASKKASSKKAPAKKSATKKVPAKKKAAKKSGPSKAVKKTAVKKSATKKAAKKSASKRRR